MPAKKTSSKRPVASPMARNNDNMGLFFQRVFAIMFGAVALTGISSYVTIMYGLPLLVGQHGFTALFYVAMFGGFGLSIWTQARIFSLKPEVGGLLLAVYSVLIGIVITPLVAGALMINPASLWQAFFLAAAMFGCMALFGYKTTKDLSFLGRFLFMGMIGLILVGVASIFWPLGSGFATIVSLIGVLVFALFTAYDMQFLKNVYKAGGDTTQRNQLAILGALHLYIAFIAMFQYILSLLNRR
ncbi:MAG: Bax inhibitor-1/YccA family protein [Alphaproteobacteria bacterium]|nr:Bax inhibitor-1/YccA family protein [Alphaproteobacteria bacterium]